MRAARTGRLARLVGDSDLTAARHLQPLRRFPAQGFELRIGEGALEDVEERRALQLREGLAAGGERGEDIADLLFGEAGQADLGHPAGQAADAGEEGGDLRIVQRQRAVEPFGGGRGEHPRGLGRVRRRHLGFTDDQVLVARPLPGGDALAGLVEFEVDRGADAV